MIDRAKNNILVAWLVWHFYTAPRFLCFVWKNYLFFVADYFSIPLLVMTAFSPWRKYRWAYPNSFDIGQYIGNAIFNTFSRLMGFVCRVILIILGIISEAVVVIVGAVVVVFWVLMPVIWVLLIRFLFYA